MRALPALTLAALLASCGPPAPAEELCLAADQQAMSRVCEGSMVVTGPDVSTYQGTVTWASVKAAGHSFAIARMSDGLNSPDNQFAANWRGMRAAGLVRGVYQFFRPAQDPTQQANMLISAVNAAGGFQPDDLPPVMDMEVTDSQTTAVIRANMQIWLDRVEALTHKKPIIYTAAFMNATVGTGFGAYPLWVANYGVTCPMVPDSWSSWRFWQYTSTGSISGISGNVDTDKWNGTLAALNAFAATTVGGADAGPRPDAGAPDAGLGTDAGVRPDAGLPSDAGTSSDAGLPPDDAGLPEVDAGTDGGSGLVMGQGAAIFIQQCSRGQ